MLALYLLALCVLVLEVTLTRVFSVMSWHTSRISSSAWPFWDSGPRRAS